MSERKRHLDIVKGLAIIGVVAGHCGVASSFFYVFHVPLFFFVSGILAKDAAQDWHELGQRLFKHVRHYWVPFVVLELLALSLHNVFYQLGWVTTLLVSWQVFGEQTLKIITFGGGEQLLGALWFLIVLCEITCFFDILLFCLRKYIQSRQNIILILTACILTVLGVITDLPRSLSRSAFFFIYFCAGYLSRKRLFQNAEGITNSWIGWIECVISLLVVWGAAWFHRSYETTKFLPLSILCAFCGIGCFFFLANKIQDLWLSQVLVFCGRYSFYIMAFHFIGFKCYTTFLFLLGYEDATVLSSFPVIEKCNLIHNIIYLLFGLCLSIFMGYSWMKIGVAKKMMALYRNIIAREAVTGQ